MLRYLTNLFILSVKRKKYNKLEIINNGFRDAFKIKMKTTNYYQKIIIKK